MTFRLCSSLMAVAHIALAHGSSAHTNARPEEAIATSKGGGGEQAFGTSLLPTEVTITQKHHKNSAFEKLSAPQRKTSNSKVKPADSKSKDTFQRNAGSTESLDNRALPSSFLAASSTSSSTASSHASLLSDRSLEPLESLELDSNLEGLGQHEHNEEEEDLEPAAYRIAPEDAPRFPGSVLEVGGDSDEDEESDPEDYQGLGLTTSESKSMRDVFHAAGSLHRQKERRNAPRTDVGEGLSGSLMEDLEISHPQRTHKKLPKKDTDDGDSISSSLLEDLDISHRDKAHRKVTTWEEEADADEEVGNRRPQDEVSNADIDEEELLRKDSNNDITEEARQSLKSFRRALQGSSVPDLHDDDLLVRPKRGKAKHGSAPKAADTDSSW